MTTVKSHELLGHLSPNLFQEAGEEAKKTGPDAANSVNNYTSDKGVKGSLEVTDPRNNTGGTITIGVHKDENDTNCSEHTEKDGTKTGSAGTICHINGSLPFKDSVSKTTHILDEDITKLKTQKVKVERDTAPANAYRGEEHMIIFNND